MLTIPLRNYININWSKCQQKVIIDNSDLSPSDFLTTGYIKTYGN